MGWYSLETLSQPVNRLKRGSRTAIEEPRPRGNGQQGQSRGPQSQVAGIPGGAGERGRHRRQCASLSQIKGNVQEENGQGIAAPGSPRRSARQFVGHSQGSIQFRPLPLRPRVRRGNARLSVVANVLQDQGQGSTAQATAQCPD